MKLFKSTREWMNARAELNVNSIGFVPTMGALHAGHRSLIDRCLAENDYSVVSIFLNPTQFDQAGDLADYPTALKTDLQLLGKAGVEAVLVLETADMYRDGYTYRVIESGFSRQLCGAQRAGHFDGVLTVVMKLLNLVRPSAAYFGEKDFQQLELVRGMVDAFFMDINIVSCPVVREEDGLAMSSRNARLDPHQRELAASLYAEICRSQTCKQALKRLKKQGFDVDYVEDYHGRRFAAASLGNTRLIDNVPISKT